MNDQRILKILQALEELTQTAGEQETTKIIPNCQVINDSPSGMTDYIIVKNELGYNIPAVKVPGISYSNGDFVNLLLVKGTEPIAFQHGSNSGTGGFTTYKLVSPDGSIDPAWEVDGAGNLLNTGGGKLDLQGTPEAIILDGDGDTSIYAFTDDQLEFSIGGIETVRFTVDGIRFPNEGSVENLHFCEGRLTLTTVTPVLTSNVTGATTIYFTPFHGNRVSVYTGVFWKTLSFSEISMAVPSTIYRLFDIFCYDNAGTLTLETVNWNQATAAITGATNATPIVITSNGHGLSNNDLVGILNVGGNTAANGIWSVANVTANTFELEGSTGSGAYTSGGTWYKLNETRATALTTQNGVYVKSGATTRTYLGTGMTTSTSGQIEMTSSNFLLWNYYNRVFRPLAVSDANNHTYTSTTVRVYRNVNSNKVAVVIGVVEDVGVAILESRYNFDSGDTAVQVGAALNRTGVTGLVTRVADVLDAQYLADYGQLTFNTGYNFLQMVQQGGATSPDFIQSLLRSQVFI